MKEAIVWIVGKYIKEYKEGPVWDLQGIYDTEQKAVDNCTKDNYFVGTMEMNAPISDGPAGVPDLRYPRLEEE